jgi:hypothetical protein
MLIEWAVMAAAAVVAVLLADWAIRSGEGDAMGERSGVGVEPPGQVVAAGGIHVQTGNINVQFTR